MRYISIRFTYLLTPFIYMFILKQRVHALTSIC